MGGINDIERAGNKYYIVDDRSNLYVMNSNFILLRHKNVKGRGPGEVGSSYAIRANNEGLLVFDTENLKIVWVKNSLEFIRELQTSDLILIISLRTRERGKFFRYIRQFFI